MRTVRRIFIHCSATREGQDVKTGTIDKWHTDPKPRGRGWSAIGYHYVYELDGSEHVGRPLWRSGAGVSGKNEDSIHLCYIGGCDPVKVLPNGQPASKDTRTPTQKANMYQRVSQLLEQFPGATVHGHNEFAAKACPCFDVQKDWPEWQLENSGLSPDLTPGLSPEDMRDEDFDPKFLDEDFDSELFYPERES